MKLYHYSKELFDQLKTLEQQGVVSKADKDKGYKHAQTYNRVGAYFEHISFFFEKIIIHGTLAMYYKSI